MSHAGPTPAVVQTAWARAVIDGLIAAGVRDVIVSPGSRSTPLLCAALASSLRCTPVVDERTAAFFALGQARATGRPTATLCTSGTAAGHALPAILEASHAGLPLVVVTADRPPGLHDCGAPQTMDQSKLFADVVRGFADLGVPDGHVPAIAAARRRVAQLAHAAQFPAPGPVHLNVPLRKPLEPAAPATEADHAFLRELDAILRTPVTRAHAPASRATDHAIARLAAACAHAERGIIVAGPAPAHAADVHGAAAALAEATGFPVLVESASQLRFTGSRPAGFCDAFEVLLSSPRFTASPRPDLVIQLGPAPVSSAWRDYLARTDCDRWVITEDRWHDPTSDASDIVFGSVDDAARRLAAQLPGDAPRTPWRQRWVAANDDAWHHLERAIGASDRLSEPAAMRTVLANLPAGARLMLGNSLPIRGADAWCPATAARARVLTQRGLSGIDGLVAGAAGAASVGDGPVVLVVGDVSFAHDAASLAVAGDLPNPLAVVVIDNRGGRIFDRLPIAASEVTDAQLDRFWRTPQHLDVAGLATAYGVAVSRPQDERALATALADATARRATSVIHVEVDPHSARTCLAAAIDGFDRAWEDDRA